MNGAKPKVEKPTHPARRWWRMLTGWPDGHSADRGALANLRRCRKPVDALMVPATFNLIQRLPKSNKDRVAVLAVVLAHIRGDTPSTTIARAIGRKSLRDEDSALLSEGRFRRLLQTDGNEELLTNMVRLMRHLKSTANVEDMADTILWWNDRQRRRWAFDYYGAGAALTETPDIPETLIEEARS